MKSHIYLPLLLIIAISLASCADWYSVVPEFDKKTQDHETLAVLPFEIVMKGKVPKKLTEKDVDQIELAEAKAFQIAMHNQIMRSLKHGKYSLDVKLMSTQSVNAKLEEHDISIDQVRKMKPKELSKLLNADALFYGRVVQHRYLTDLESFGVDIANSILNTITHPPFYLYLDDTEKSIFVSGNIIDGNTDETLFSAEREFDVDWNNDEEDIIRRMCYRIAKKIPYRKKV